MINEIRREVDGEIIDVEVDTADLSDAQYYSLFPLLWEDTIKRFCRYHHIDYEAIKQRQIERENRYKRQE